MVYSVMTQRIFLVSLILLVLVSAASSDIYKYTDENGVICYTDAPFGKKTEKILKEQKINPLPVAPDKNYSGHIKRASLKYQLEPELIHAVIKTESNGNHRAVSKKGAMGLMQLMPSTASDMSVSNPFNPEENIEGGTRYLRYLLEKFNGNLTLALAAYNAGPKRVETYGAIPPIAETQEYVRKVYSLYQGRRSYGVAGSLVPEKPAQIYKVVLEDGTILFTNSTFVKQGSSRF